MPQQPAAAVLRPLAAAVLREALQLVLPSGNAVVEELARLLHTPHSEHVLQVAMSRLAAIPQPSRAIRTCKGVTQRLVEFAASVGASELRDAATGALRALELDLISQVISEVSACLRVPRLSSSSP